MDLMKEVEPLNISKQINSKAEERRSKLEITLLQLFLLMMAETIWIWQQ
jgi:hypothetical protein